MNGTELIDTAVLVRYPRFCYNVRMRENRVSEQNRCCHLIRRRVHRAFFPTDEGLNRAVSLMRRVEAGVQADMSYSSNRAVALSADPLSPLFKQEYAGTFKSGGAYTQGVSRSQG